jgi:hypothetical protein
MLILAALIVAVVVAWIIISPLLLPAPATPEAARLDGRWTSTPDDPLGTTLSIAAGRYELIGDLDFTGAGTATLDGQELVLTGDPACPDAEGRYAVSVVPIDRAGLLPQFQSEAMRVELVDDPCADGARAATLTAVRWVLRASGRDDAHGICDPPDEEAAITGHWPEPSGCG